MPTYQYQCTDCGEGLEAVQKFTDDALTECPSCDGRLRKVFSAVGVVFKGSGFYRTDSRAGAKGSSSKSSSSSNGSGDSSSGSKDSGTKGSGSKDSGGSSKGDSKPASTTSAA
ncbi:zinc ribbon domain-containing protein [Streptomyces capparidis]